MIADANASLTVNGADTIDFAYSGASVNASSDAIIVTGSNISGATVNGSGDALSLTAANSNDSIHIGDNASISVMGNDDSVSFGNAAQITAGGVGDSLSGSYGSGNGAVVNLISTAQYDNVEAGNNSSMQALGAGNNSFSVGANSTAIINESFDGVSAGINSTVQFTGSYEDFSGNQDSISATNNTSIDVVSGSYDSFSGGLSDGVQLDAGGNDTVSLGAGATFAEGAGDGLSNDSITLGAGSIVDEFGSNDSIAVGTGSNVTMGQGYYLAENDSLSAGSSSVINLLGSGLSITASGDTIALGFDTSATIGNNSNSDAITCSNQDQLALNGANNSVDLGGSNFAVINGGNNAISDVQAGDGLVLENTNGAFDTITGNGAEGGQTTATGEFTGISLTNNTQANVTGSNNGIFLGTGVSLNANGGSNSITSGSGDAVHISGTGSNADWVYSNLDYPNGRTFNGQETGIFVGDYSQVGIVGNNNGIFNGSHTIDSVTGWNDASSGNSSDEVDYYGGVFAGDTAEGGEESSDNEGDGPGDSSTDCTSGYWTTEDDGDGDSVDVWVDDPIILNLTGGTVQTAGLFKSPAYFDMQNDGQKIQTGWATAGEGLLVYDPNNTDAVSADSNLIGGFGALEQLAGTQEGLLDANNPLWDQLKVWVDPSGNASFQPGELYSLDQLGITSINLNAVAEQIDSNGNTLVGDSTFTWKNGTSGDIAAVDLVSNPAAIEPLITSAANLSTPAAAYLADDDLFTSKFEDSLSASRLFPIVGARDRIVEQGVNTSPLYDYSHLMSLAEGADRLGGVSPHNLLNPELWGAHQLLPQLAACSSHP